MLMYSISPSTAFPPQFQKEVPPPRMKRALSSLLHKARKGDRQALVRLISKYEPLIMKLAARYLNFSTDIDDLQQAGRLGVWSAVDTYKDDGASFFTWVFYKVRAAIQREAGVYVSRRQKKLTSIHELEIDPPSSYDLHQTVDQLLTCQQLDQMLNILPPNQQQVLRLRLLGNTFSEVGWHIGFTRSRAQQLASTAMKKLKVCFAKDVEDNCSEEFE